MSDAAQRIQWRLKAKLEEVESEVDLLTSHSKATDDDQRLTYLEGYLEGLNFVLQAYNEERLGSSRVG